MDYKDAIEQIRESIKVMNREGGEIRDEITSFKADNAEGHGQMQADIKWIKTGIWGIFIPLLLLLIKAGLDITNLIK